MDLFELLEVILVVGILCSVVYAIVQWVPMAPPFRVAAYGILALICVVIFFEFMRGSGLNLRFNN